MKIIQVQNLQAQEIQTIDDHQLLFRGKLFRLGPKISKKLEKAALEYCQVCCNAGQACLLQEDESHWIIWKRVRQANSAIPPKPLSSTQPAKLSADFTNRCKQELTDCIGPIAGLVLEQTLSDLGTDNMETDEFIFALSQRIPSTSLASKFREHCTKATDSEVVASRVRFIKVSSAESRYSFNRSKMVHSPVSI